MLAEIFVKWNMIFHPIKMQLFFFFFFNANMHCTLTHLLDELVKWHKKKSLKAKISNSQGKVQPILENWCIRTKNNWKHNNRDIYDKIANLMQTKIKIYFNLLHFMTYTVHAMSCYFGHFWEWHLAICQIFFN